jgi:hypothetical protein
MTSWRWECWAADLWLYIRHSIQINIVLRSRRRNHFGKTKEMKLLLKEPEGEKIEMKLFFERSEGKGKRT